MNTGLLEPFKPLYNKLASIVKRNPAIVTFLVLTAIFIYAFVVRSFDINGPYLNADDPYQAYRIVEYAIDNNMKLPTNDTYLNYPDGLNDYQSYFLWYLIPAFFGMIFKVFGVANPALLAMKFYPPLFGALMTLAAYFIGKQITGSRWAGMLTSLFMAFSQTVMSKTISSSAIKEPLGGVFMLLSAIFFIKSLKKFNLKDSILSGVILAISAYSWGGTNAYVFMLAVFAFVCVLINNFRPEFTHTYLVTIGVYFVLGYLTYFILGGGPFPRISQLYILTNIIAVVGIVVLLAARKYNIVPQNYAKYLGTYAIIGALVLAAISAFIYAPFGDYTSLVISKIDAPLASNDVVASTVAYYRQSTISEVVSQVNGGTFSSVYNKLILLIGTFTLSLVGFAAIAYLMYKKRIWETGIFMLVWYFSWIMLGRGAIRMVYLSAIIASIFAAIGVYYIVKFLTRHKEDGYWSKLVGSMWNSSPGRALHKIFHTKSNAEKSLSKILIMLLVGFLLFVNVTSGYLAGKSMGVSMSPNWENALVWLKENSNENDAVLSWWDYGYIIHWYAQRHTYSDPGRTGGVDADVMIAKIFTSTNETEVSEKLKELNVKYIIHDVSMVGKYSAVSTIASNANYVDNYLEYPVGDSKCLEPGTNGACNKAVIQFFNRGQGGVPLEPQLWAVQEGSGIRPLFVQQNQFLNISTICTPTGERIEIDAAGLPGCAYFGSNAAVLMGVRCTTNGCGTVDLSNTMFSQMWYFNAQSLENFKKVYDNGEVKIFEFLPDGK